VLQPSDRPKISISLSFCAEHDCRRLGKAPFNRDLTEPAAKCRTFVDLLQVANLR